jgi:uncharacterized membrane protein YfcA
LKLSGASCGFPNCDANAVERSKVEVEAAIASQRAKLNQRTRPPLMIGVFLIFLGFVGQMIGTLWGAPTVPALNL